VRSFEEIERELDAIGPAAEHGDARERLLALSEEVLEAWIAARGEAPTAERREGFRLLALHHQGARATPSFNACRETCREIAYRYNLLASDTAPAGSAREIAMMVMLVRHLALFVGGKMQVERLGDFCCASRPVRERESTMAQGANAGDSNA
jgi:hypothetical protein